MLSRSFRLHAFPRPLLSPRATDLLPAAVPHPRAIPIHPCRTLISLVWRNWCLTPELPDLSPRRVPRTSCPQPSLVHARKDRDSNHVPERQGNGCCPGFSPPRELPQDHLHDSFGNFGVIVTRKPAPRNVVQNTVDLYSAHRCAVIVLTDQDLDLMLRLMQSRRRPIDALKKAFVEFSRLLPS